MGSMSEAPKDHTLRQSSISLHNLQTELTNQRKIKAGAVKLMNSTTSSDSKAIAKQEIDDTNHHIIQLEKKIEAVKRLTIPEFESSRNRSNTISTNLTGESFNSYYSSSLNEDYDTDTEYKSNYQNIGDFTSPTWALADILHSLGDKEKNPEYLIKKSNDLVVLLQQNVSLKEDLVLSSIIHKIQGLLLSSNSIVVGCGYRLLRYILNDIESLEFFNRMNLDIFFVGSFSKDIKHLIEREECLKLMRKFISTVGGLNQISVNCVRSIVSILENTDDPLRIAAYETLVEISLLNPELSFKANAIKPLMQIVLEGPFSLAGISCLTFVKMLELPTTRPFVLDEKIIQMLISPFMEITHPKVEKLQSAGYVITSLLKTWPGLVAFSQNSFEPLKQLLSCLTFDSTLVKNVLIHMLYDLFRIRSLPWIIAREDNSNSSILIPRETELISHPTKANSTSRSTPEKESSVVNHYTALLLKVALDCDLIPKLIAVFENSTDNKQIRKIVVLLSEISFIKSYLIPDQLIPRMSPSFKLNNLIEKEIRKHHGASMINGVNYLHEHHYNADLANKFSRDIKMRFMYLVDDADLKILLNNTHVLFIKDYTKWDWLLIIELMQGPLRNPRKFEETVKTTKFYKRLMSFYRPFKYRFSALKKTKHNLIYIKAGCEIFKSLLSNAEGVRYLTENKILPQIAECLAQVDPYSGITASDPLFSKSKLETTLSSGFFSFLGVLSSDVNGSRMLEQWWIFDMLYHITDRKTDRPDLMKLIIREMKYDTNGHLRIILSKVSCTGSNSIRIFATKFLGTLLEIEDCENFACQSLVNQLCDPDLTICNISIEFLTRFAKDDNKILQIIQNKPEIEHLGVIAVPLMLKMLSTEPGFHYLQDLNFVESEMELWIDFKNKLYVNQIESFMIKKLYNFKNPKALPYHFFGELVKTREGASLLESMDTLTSFSNVVNSYISIMQSGKEVEFYRNASREEQDEIMLDLKSVLWAIGHVGSSDYGITLLELSDLTDSISYICGNSLNWSLKGTCFHVMGLISQTNQGLEILDDLGWLAKTSSLNLSLAICLPKSFDSFFAIDCAYEKDSVKLNRILEKTTNEVFEQVMESDFLPYSSNQKIYNSSSSAASIGYPQEYFVLFDIFENLILILVNQGKAYNNLNKIKAKFPTLFESEPSILKLIVQILEIHAFKTQVRKYLFWELIDFNKMMEVLIKRHRKKLKDLPMTTGLQPVAGYGSNGAGGQNAPFSSQQQQHIHKSSSEPVNSASNILSVEFNPVGEARVLTRRPPPEGV